MQEAVLITALAYAFLNGLHDAPTVLAQVISTRSLEPRKALIWVAALEFAGAMLLSGAVLKTMSFGALGEGLLYVPQDDLQAFVLACLLAALIFNTATWRLGLPSSSSHALFGAMAGAALLFGFARELILAKIVKIVLVLMLSAVGAMLAAWLIASFLYCIDFSYAAGSRLFPPFNALSSGILAMLHGANDVPKSLGLVLLSFGGAFTESDLRIYLLVFSAVVSLGMLFGENRILRTLGQRLFRVRTLQGAGANAASWAIMGTCTWLGLPVSFTQVAVGSLSGACAARRISSVRWDAAGEVLLAWLITLPASMALGFGFAYLFSLG